MIDERVISALERVGFAVSEQTAELWQALLKAAGKLKNITPRAIAQRATYSYKYIDLGTLLDEVKDHLTENNLIIVQMPVSDFRDGKYLPGLATLLVHVPSGQFLAFKSHIQSDVHQHVFGATVTYTRKYHVQSVLSICAEMDDDAGAEGVTVVKPALESKQLSQPARDSSNDNDGASGGSSGDGVIIVDVRETKSGYLERKSSDGKIVKVPWILFEIRTNNGVFKTFDKGVVEQCAQLAGSGTRVQFDVDGRGVVKAVRAVG